MAKVTIEFDSIEESIELRQAINATSWYSVVFELDQELRKMAKYNNDDGYAQSIRDILHGIINDNEVSL